MISTNGRLLPRGRKRSRRGFSYVGISLTTEETNDQFRGVTGAFNDALAACNCLAMGQVGLRFTMTRNLSDVGGILDLIEREGIPACASIT